MRRNRLQAGHEDINVAGINDYDVPIRSIGSGKQNPSRTWCNDRLSPALERNTFARYAVLCLVAKLNMRSPPVGGEILACPGAAQR